jgi:UDP-galactopyranose mutase
MQKNKPILVVGAGFSGAVYARCLAEAGYEVKVIDKRPHIAGNAYDEVGPDGVRIHRYGPHLFHTANARVLAWVRRFGGWTPFTHRVKALLPGGSLAPMPVNLDTVNAVFGTRYATGAEVDAHLARISIPSPQPRNAAEYLGSRIGRELTDLFFRPYTKKMWGMDLEDMSAAVVKRIPLRTDTVDTYFPDTDEQILPDVGYTALFESIFDHPMIKVELKAEFRHDMLGDFEHAFLSMPIDEFYGFSEGELPYRSIRFHHHSAPADALPDQWKGGDEGFSVINFTDSGPFTRETAWHRLPGHLVTETGRRTLTREEPCDYRDNTFERYYPVKTADGANDEAYAKYVALSRHHADTVTFIGRCGTYRYLDMDQVINQSLMGVESWIKNRRDQAA